MERQQLIAKIEGIMPIVNKWIEYIDSSNKQRRRISELEGAIAETKFNFINLFQNVWLSLVICFLFGGILLLPIEWFTDKKITLPFYIVFVSILTVILSIVLICRSLKDNAVMKGNLPKLKAEYDEIQNRFQREVKPYMPQIYAIFPKNYADPYTIKKLYSYLVNQRADNMKEAINLLEQERYQQDQQRQLDAFDQQIADMQRNQKELEQRVADAEFEANQAYIKSLYQ